MRRALTIAGSDSGGGAGLQADLKTFTAFGVFGTTAITAITVQNTLSVARVFPLPADLVIDQIRAVADDIGTDAVKIGMLGTAEIAHAVADYLEDHTLGPVVLDTVMVATSGGRLIQDEGVEVMRRRLLGRAALVTANIPEAEALTGLTIASVAAARDAAKRLVEIGARAALVKGGHLEGPPTDILCAGALLTEFHAPRVDTPHTHGTGCTLAAAITARLAVGDDLAEAIRAAKAYVTRALVEAPGIGHGHGPLRHFPL
jgi:hydroxymethylpyrimidine/phosphomethylpyrimidine kinase